MQYTVLSLINTPRLINAPPPPFFLYPLLPESQLAWKNLLDTSLLRVALSTWFSHGQSVVSVGINARGCTCCFNTGPTSLQVDQH